MRSGPEGTVPGGCHHDDVLAETGRGGALGLGDGGNARVPGMHLAGSPQGGGVGLGVSPPETVGGGSWLGPPDPAGPTPLFTVANVC